MNRTRQLLAAGLALLSLNLSAAEIRAAGPAGSVGKPGAPVELRWLETGTSGRISVEVVSGIDYDTLELRLLVPGLTSTLAPITLDGGAAGAIRRADWYLADEPADTPRVLVILEAAGQRLGRVVPAPWADGKSRGPVPARAPMPKATADGLIEMRGETRHRREAEQGMAD